MESHKASFYWLRPKLGIEALGEQHLSGYMEWRTKCRMNVNEYCSVKHSRVGGEI